MLPLYNERLPQNAQHDRIDIILVSPRNPLNIGAAARAMANFAFSRLTVVAPYQPHWREAKSAVGAEDLLQHARVTASLAEAVADCTLVLGTGSLERRKPEQRVVALPSLCRFVGQELADHGRIALVFGPEKRGLTRDDLALCHAIVEIPTDPRQPSMNLAQAVAVCLYELSSRLSAAPCPGSTRPAHATSARLEMLAGLIEETMSAASYSPAERNAANRHDLRLLLRRLDLCDRDAHRILGLFRRILWKIRHQKNMG